MKTLRVVVLAAIAFMMAGCVIPFKFTTRQGATGIVIEESGGAPVSGASVIVLAGSREASGVTGPDGRFLVPGITKWGAYVVPMDPAPIQWSLTIRAKGYREYSTKAVATVMQAGVRDVGEIRLKKEERTNSAESRRAQ